jgi:predicted outer membrane repeat protein
MHRFVPVLILSLLLAGLASAETYVIQPDGSGDYPTIQAAVTASEDGDIIELADGTFMGDGNRDILPYSKAITIRSQSGNAEACIIDPEGGPELTRRAFFLQYTSADFSLENITMMNGSALAGGASDYGGAIKVELGDGASPAITGCIFSNNTAGRGGAIFFIDASAAEVTDCTFSGNTGEGYGGAVFITGEDCLPSFEGCTFYDNSSLYGGGFAIWNDAAPTITNCTLYGNSGTDPTGGGGGVSTRWGASPILANTIIAFSTEGAAVACMDAEDSPTLTCCDLYGNVGGDWIDCIEGQDAGDGNISADPLFVDPENNDFHLTTGSPCAAFSPPNDTCDLIGAWPGSDTPVNRSSWGEIKAIYR